jgi:hypothetical protein
MFVHLKLFLDRPKNSNTSVAIISYLLLLTSYFFLSSSATAQDLYMRRTNSVGHWRAYVGNDGILFHQDIPLGMPNSYGEGGFWTRPNGSPDTMIFAAGLWLGGQRVRNGVLTPHVEYSYEPNSGHTTFVPGSRVYDGAAIDSTEFGRDRYRVYRSTDLSGPPWPLRMVNGKSCYIDEPLSRDQFGPKAVLGDEDLFVVYKDSDPAQDADAFQAEIRSTISFWQRGLLKDVMFVRNEIIYSGADTIFDPVVALVVDGDINNPGDDRLKGVRQEGVRSAVFFTDQSTTQPLLAVTLLNGQHGADRHEDLTALRYWDILEDPLSDSERYEFLIRSQFDTALSKIGDARVLMTSLSNKPIAKGDTVYFDYALFAQLPTGPALTSTDSANMLHTADALVSHYRSGTLDLLLSSVGPSQKESPFRIFPNPASDHVAVSGIQGGAVWIYDGLGREVLLTRYEAIRGLDVRGLSPGVYWLRSEAGSGMLQIAR